MDTLTADEIQSLARVRHAHCISLMMPTRGGGAEEDPLVWKNLVREAEDSLGAVGCGRDASRLLQPARALLSDTGFWRSLSQGGFVCFLTDGAARTYHLPEWVAPAAVLAPRFHLKPVLPFVFHGGEYFLLAISKNAIRLIRGSSWSAAEIPVAGMPANLKDASQFHDRDEPLEFHTYPALGLGRRGAIFHGQGVGIDDAKDDLLRYFRAVDHGLHTVLRGHRAPLILASVEYLWPIYREANTYPRLLSGGVSGNPDKLSVAELHARALPIVEPVFKESFQRQSALFARFAGTGRTTSDLVEGVTASAHGRVETLFVATGTERWGRLEAPDGAIAAHDRPEPGDEDLLNVAALETLVHGGDVFAVPVSDVPGQAPLAAMYWMPHATKGTTRKTGLAASS